MVYAVEHAVTDIMDRGALVNFHGSTLDFSLNPDIKFAQPIDAQRWVDLVWSSLDRTDPPPMVRAGKGHRRAYYTHSTHTITLPRDRWALRALVVGHELTHAIVGRSGRDHGPEFRREYIDIVRRFVSPEAALILAEGLDKIEAVAA